MIRKILIALLLICMAAQAEAQQRIRVETVPVLKAVKAAIDAKDWKTAIETGEAAHSSDYSDFEWFLLQRFLLAAYFNVNNQVGASLAAYNCVMSPAISAADLKALLSIALTLANEQNDTARVLEIARVRADAIAEDERASTIVAGVLYNSGDKIEARRYAKHAAELARAAGHEPEAAVQQVLQYTEGF